MSFLDALATPSVSQIVDSVFNLSTISLLQILYFSVIPATLPKNFISINVLILAN